MNKFYRYIFALIIFNFNFVFTQSTPDGLARKRFYDVQHIIIKVSFDESKKIVFGNCTTTLQPLENNFSSFELDAIDMNVNKIFLSDQKELKYENTKEKLKIFLNRPYSRNEKITFTIDYNCSPYQGLYFVQPDSNNPNKPFQIWTQGQGKGNDHWFPCYNYYNDKTTTETIITVKENYFALSNGKLLDISHNEINHTKTFHWKMTKPHATYLVMLAVGEYSIIEDKYKNIPVQYYVYKGQEIEGKRCFQQTPEMIKFFSKVTGIEYPWEKYAQVCIADFMYGGMENTTATTLNDIRAVYDKRAELDYQNTGLVAHELAHQWWGDFISQKDGISHWIQEGFATYFEALYEEYKYGKDEFMRVMENNMLSYKDAELKQGKIPMVSKTSPFVYVKGASFLNMMRFILGENDFFKSVKAFIKKYSYSNANSDDFKDVIKNVTGKDLTWFFDEWLYKASYPTFEVTKKYDETKKKLVLNVKQIHKTDSIIPVFKMPVDIEICLQNKSIIKILNIEKTEETFEINVDSKPLNIIFDKGNWIVKNTVFEKSKDELLFQLKNSKLAIERKEAVQQLYKYTSDDNVFKALKDHFNSEKDWTVRLEILDSSIVLKRKEGLEILLKALNDKKSAVRIESIINLRYFPSEIVSSNLRRIIETDSSYYAVGYALMSLANIEGVNSLDMIEKNAYKNSYRDIIKMCAINSLEFFNDKKVIPILKNIKNSASFLVRKKIDEILKKLDN